jgi:predicted RNA-binding Zn-ribbon protein involved in translation (DUF1610 family)
MIAYKCPVCGEKAMLVCSPAKDMTLGVAQTCLQCSAEIAVLLIVMEKEKLMAYIKRGLKR